MISFKTFGDKLKQNIFNRQVKEKLDTVESGATSNSPDAYLLARANHTGTQLSSTISDLNTATATLTNKTISGSNNTFSNIPQSAVIALVSDLSNKQNTITTGTTLQYYRGDKTFQTLNTSVVPESTNLYYTDVRVRLNRLDQMAIPTATVNLNSQFLNYLGGIYSYGLTGTSHSTTLNFGSPSNLGSTAGTIIKNVSFGAYSNGTNAISLTTFTKRIATDASGWNTAVFGMGYAVDNSFAPYGGVLYFSQRNNLGGIGIDCDTPLARFHISSNENTKAIFDGTNSGFSGIHISNIHATGSAFIGFGNNATPTNSGYIEKYPLANPTHAGKMFIANDSDISFLINGDFDLLKIQSDKNIAVKNKLLLSASTTARASINFISGTAPTSPADGDMWFDGTNLKIRVSGVTKTVTIT